MHSTIQLIQKMLYLQKQILTLTPKELKKTIKACLFIEIVDSLRMKIVIYDT